MLITVYSFMYPYLNLIMSAGQGPVCMNMYFNQIDIVTLTLRSAWSSTFSFSLLFYLILRHTSYDVTPIISNHCDNLTGSLQYCMLKLILIRIRPHET